MQMWLITRRRKKIKQLKKFPVNYQVLVSSQTGLLAVGLLINSAGFIIWRRMEGLYQVIRKPDFRRKLLLGDIEAHAVPDLTADEMASYERQIQNQEIKENALFNSQLGGPPKASTNEFTRSRCKKTTYHQLRTRTFVTCNKRWKCGS